MNINSQSVLYVVATPIGNLQDISYRAIETLKKVACIVAEDTRHSQPLLQHFNIKTPIMALHEHNERERTQKILQRLEQGESIALISDAGTPLISDPGYYLVHAARQQGIAVMPIPGACAAIAALSVSGLATDRFIFEGFLPVKKNQRLQHLQKLCREKRSIIFYEAPHRILELLEALQEVFGKERQAVIARELTKLFETVTANSLEKLLEFVSNDANQQKGEMVVILEGAKEESEESQINLQKTLTILLESLPLKQAVELTAQITGQSKNSLYARALELKKRHNMGK